MALVAAGLFVVMSTMAEVQWAAWIGFVLVLVGLAAILVVWRLDRAKRQNGDHSLQAVKQALDTQSRRLEAFSEIAAAVGQSLDLREVLELGLEPELFPPQHSQQLEIK